MTKWTAPDIASIRGDNSRPLQKIFGSLSEHLKDYQNGYTLDSLDDVTITTPTAGQTLSYDAVNSLWKNATFSDGGGLTNLNASNLASGTVPTGRMTGAYTGITSLGTLTSLTIDGPSSPSVFFGDWNQNNNWSGIRGSFGYLLTGSSGGLDTGVYLRSESTSHPIRIGSNNTNTLTVTNTSATVAGTMNATALTISGLSSLGEVLATTVLGTTNRGIGIKADPTNAQSILQFTNNAVSSQWSSLVATNGLLTATTPFKATQYLQNTDYLSPYQGFRNKIINGNFEVWQRGTTRTFMQAGQYRADRWTVRLYQQAAHQRVGVASPIAGMQTRYALRCSSSTTAEAGGGTRMWTNTELESFDSIPLRGKTMTFSFYVRFSGATCSSSTATPYGNWTASIDYCDSTSDQPMATTGANGGGGSVTLVNGSLPTTWTKYTGTYTIPSGANNVGIAFGFGGLGNTASADTVWYEITQVQLEEGSVVTPFEQRPYQTELALCQRYYQQQPLILSGATNGGFGNSYLQTFTMSPEMRTTPTVFFYPSVNYGGTVGNVTAYPGGVGATAILEFANSSAYSLNKNGVGTYTLFVYSVKLEAEL